MIVAQIVFWMAVAWVVYTYALYPLSLAAVARWRRRLPGHVEPFIARCESSGASFSSPLPGTPERGRGEGSFPSEGPARPFVTRSSGTVSVILAAYNEAGNIGRRIIELSNFVATLPGKGEVIVVSDGSTDGTAQTARTFASELVRVLELPTNQGKAAALNAGCAAATGEIVVLADTRQRWAPDAMACLLRNFGDAEVGAVSGDLVLESSPGVMAGVGAYWRFEKWIRRQESRVHSVVGVTGAISAVRRRLLRPIPPGTILDDVYWPLQVVMQGYRVIHEPQAKAYDRLPQHTGDEFRRKVRTLSANFQLMARLPEAMLPWRNPIWWQFLSHKVFRLVAPWALLTMLGMSVVLPGGCTTRRSACRLLSIC